MLHYNDYKRSQSKSSIIGKKEEHLFKTIMCPLKEKCNKIKVPRWPTSNIKTHT